MNFIKLVLVLFVGFEAFAAKKINSFSVNETFEEVTGHLWVVRPSYYKYRITPREGTYCDFSAEWKRPKKGVGAVKLAVIYYDPGLSGQKGQERVFESFGWQPASSITSPFERQKPWKATAEGGNRVSTITFDKKEPKTYIYTLTKGPIEQHTWTEITTTEDFKDVTGVKISWAFQKKTPENERQTLLDCQKE